MKSFRKMLLLLLVLLLIPMMAACGDDDKDEKNSGGFTMAKGKNTAEGIVEAYVKNTEILEDAEEEVETTCLMFQNPKALKKLDLYDEDDDDDDDDYTWKITKSKNYDEDSDVTEGIKSYVESRYGDGDAIDETALVEVTVTYKQSKDDYYDDDDDDGDGDYAKKKYYFSAAKIGGTWYIVSDNARRADSISEAAEYWESRSSNSNYYDD